jgi:ABC-2 type transport system permease protein
MAEPGWPRHLLDIGRFEFQRSVRAVWQHKVRLTAMVFGVLIISVMFAVFTVVFAETIRGIETRSVPKQLQGTIALFWLFAVFMIGQRVVSARPRIDAESLMLTTVSPRTVAGGLLVAETLRFLAYLCVPALTMTGAVFYLFGSPASLVVIPVTAVLFAVTSVVAGSMCGFAVSWLVATSPFVARHKTVLGSFVALIGMGGYFLFFYGIGGLSQSALAWLPMGWFADLAAVGTPLAGSLVRPVGALLGSVALLFVGGVIIERETVALWFTEPVSPDAGDSAREIVTEQAERTRLASRDPLAAAVTPLLVPRVVSLPTRRVAEWTLLRTRRDPRRLLFLLIPVFAIGSSLVSTGLQSGSLRALAAPVCAVLLPWLAGALFAMNPLGDEGAVLPVTLTAVSGRQYVRGLMVPGLFLGLPIGFVVTTFCGIISPYPLTEQYGLTVLCVYLTCVSVAITPAVGMALPRFSAISVGQSREVLPPRMSAAILHLVLTLLPGALLVALIIAPRTARAVLAGLLGSLPALLVGLLTSAESGFLATTAAWFSHVGDAIQATGIGQLRIVAGGALLLGGILVSIVLYRNAIRRFERYSPA